MYAQLLYDVILYHGHWTDKYINTCPNVHGVYIMQTYNIENILYETDVTHHILLLFAELYSGYL